MLLSVSALLSAYCDLCFLRAFLNGMVFSVLGHSLERHKYIVSFSALKIFFSKLNLAKYHCMQKKPYIFPAFSYHRRSVQIFLKLY